MRVEHWCRRWAAINCKLDGTYSSLHTPEIWLVFINSKLDIYIGKNISLGTVFIFKVNLIFNKLNLTQLHPGIKSEILNERFEGNKERFNYISPV